MSIDIKKLLYAVIIKDPIVGPTYNKKHPNSKYSLTLIIDEIIYFLKSGVSLRNLRSPINFKTFNWHFNLLVKNNIFIKLFKLVRKKYLAITNPDNLLIDSTVIYNKFGVNKIGRNKFYKNKKSTKISLLTDDNGFPFSIFFIKSNYHDNSVFSKHIKDIQIFLPKKRYTILADKAYSSHANYTLLNKLNINHIIPPRKNMKIAKSYTYNKNIYIKRIIIEHIFARLKMFKRIDSRYDKLLRNFSGFVFLGLSITGINIYNKIIR